MRQFDVFPNPNKSSRRHTPYIVVLQSDYSTGPQTVIAAPVVRKRDANADDRIVIPINVDGEQCVVLLQAMAAVAIRILDQPVASAPELGERMPKAIDYLFLGM